MATKLSIIGELDEPALLLPRRLQEALAANDRLKFCFSLLQAAESHADHPQESPLDLTAQRGAVQLPAGELDAAVIDSRRDAGGALRVPGAARLRQLILRPEAAVDQVAGWRESMRRVPAATESELK